MYGGPEVQTVIIGGRPWQASWDSYNFEAKYNGLYEGCGGNIRLEPALLTQNFLCRLNTILKTVHIEMFRGSIDLVRCSGTLFDDIFAVLDPP